MFSFSSQCMVQEKLTATQKKMDIEIRWLIALLSCGARRRSEESVLDENIWEQKYKMRALFSFRFSANKLASYRFCAICVFSQMIRHRSAFLKGRVIDMWEADLSMHQVSQRVDVATQTVSDWKSRYVAEGNVTQQHGSSRPRQTAKRSDRLLFRLAKKAASFIRPSFTAAIERTRFSMDCAQKITGETAAQLSACFVPETDSASYEKTSTVMHGKIVLAASSLEAGGLHRWVKILPAFDR